MSRMFQLVIWLCLMGLLSACSPADYADEVEWVIHNNWTTATHTSTWEGVERRGLGVGFMRPEDRAIHPYQRLSTHQFRVQPGQTFATYLLLGMGSNVDEPYPVLVSLFLDYEQVGFYLDGQWGILHYLEIQPGVDMEIPLELPIETPGWHDLFVVVFLGPEYHPTDPHKRLTSLNLGGRRTVICAGECTISEYALPEPFMGVGNSADRLHVNAFPLLPGDTPPPERLLMSTTINSGDVMDLELWARNTSERSKNYIVLPLLNFQQIPFAGFKSLYLHMPPGSELFVPGQVQLPEVERVNEFQFITIFDPYRPLADITDPFVQSNLRSAIITSNNQ
jgi:hypothetical protein